MISGGACREANPATWSDLVCLDKEEPSEWISHGNVGCLFEVMVHGHSREGILQAASFPTPERQTDCSSPSIKARTA